MTKDEALKQARRMGKQGLTEAFREALAQPEQESASIIQAVTDPENQPSQYGTVTLDYHFAKLKEWEDRFEKLSDRALAQPEQEPSYWLGYGLQAHTEKPFDDATPLYTTPPQPEERNFCPRCGKRTADLTTIHTCTPPQGNT